MKRVYKLPVFCLLLLIQFETMAQTSSKLSSKEFKKEIDPVRANMNRENCSIRFKKEVFQDLSSNQMIESSAGVIYRGKGLDYKMVSNGLTSLRVNDLSIVIDSASAIVQICTPDTTMKAVDLFGEMSLDIVEQYTIEKTLFPTYVIYKAVPKNGSESTLEFFVDLKTKMLYKLKIIFSEGNYFSEEMEDETLEQPYAVMIYEPVQKLEQKENIFSYTPYLKLTSTGRFELTEAWSSYQLHDARYQEPINE